MPKKAATKKTSKVKMPAGKRNERGESPAEQAMREADEVSAPKGVEWLTPTQISKEEGMPAHAVQLLYGYIRQNKLEAKRVSGVKGQVVDAAQARLLLAQRGTRGGARPSHGPRPKAEPVVKQGTIISHERTKMTKGSQSPTAKRKVSVVTDSGRSTFWTHDGHHDSFWRTQSLADRIKEGTTQIESIPSLLAIVAYSWRQEGEDGLAKQLMDWCSGRVNEAGTIYNKLIGLVPRDIAQEGDEEDDATDD